MAGRTITLDEMTAQLRAACGPALRAVVLYGPAAQQDDTVSAEPLELLVVADALGAEDLRRVAPTVRAWREAGHPAPLLLTAREWRGSADVFPMEYAEVLDSHRVLAGALALDDVVVDRGALRRQLAHRALGVLLQLRGAILSSGNDAREQVALLAASWPSVLALLRALARVHEAGAVLPAPALIQWAAGVAGFDPVAFHRVAAHVWRPGPGVIPRVVRISPAEAPAVLAGYLAALERVVAHVDGLGAGAAPAAAGRR